MKASTLRSFLPPAGGPLRSNLKGKDVAKYLHSEGQDGFVAVFSLPEFDSGSFLVADTLNGAPTDGGRSLADCLAGRSAA
jgi:hypothetical protein